MWPPDDSKDALPLRETDLPSAFDVLRAVIEGTSDIVGAVDPEYRFTLLNKVYKAEFLRVVGREANVGDSFLDLMAHMPEDRAHARAVRSRPRRRDGSPSLGVRRSGSRPRHLRSRPVPRARLRRSDRRRGNDLAERQCARPRGGRPGGADRGTRRANEALARTLANAEIATFDWDIPHDVVRENPRMDSLYGLAHDPQGRPVASYWEGVHPEDRERLEAAIRASVDDGRRYEAQYRVRGFEGREY